MFLHSWKFHIKIVHFVHFTVYHHHICVMIIILCVSSRRNTSERHCVWAVSSWLFFHRRLLHRAVPAPQKLLRFGPEDAEMGHVHFGQPLWHSGQDGNSGVLAASHFVPHRWEHAVCCAVVQDAATVGPIWKVSEYNSFVQHIHNTHPCDNVFV